MSPACTFVMASARASREGLRRCGAVKKGLCAFGHLRLGPLLFVGWWASGDASEPLTGLCEMSKESRDSGWSIAQRTRRALILPFQRPFPLPLPPSPHAPSKQKLTALTAKLCDAGVGGRECNRDSSYHLLLQHREGRYLSNAGTELDRAFPLHAPTVPRYRTSSWYLRNPSQGSSETLWIETLWIIPIRNFVVNGHPVNGDSHFICPRYLQQQQDGACWWTHFPVGGRRFTWGFDRVCRFSSISGCADELGPF
ncbi:hypothetical protein BGZ63DRAFT_29810 [Mariannaea sp. PMI_226]|nr:hypothetical protein BGZ63DRAFT_29810 [Mariannaea sp. PMI_226]